MAIDYSMLPLSKGTPRKTLKRRLARAEAKVAAWCRAQCVARDADCAVECAFWGHRGYPFEIADKTASLDGWTEHCGGPSEWAHMHARRRSKTRGLDPTERHDPKFSLILCRLHHREYDAKRLVITALTRRGANGPLKFRRAK